MNAGQDKSISICQASFVFVPHFSKPILTRQIISKNSQEFLASRRPSTFQLYWKLLYFVIYSRILDLTSHLPLVDKDEENMTIVFILFIIPNSKMPVGMWWQIFQTWTNYLHKGFRCSWKWSFEVLELVALFLLKTGTFSAKNW